MLRIHYVSVIILCVILCTSCSVSSTDIYISDSTVEYLSYGLHDDQLQRVYVKEGDRVVPFLVFDTVDNTTLLLREFLLDDLHVYQKSGQYGSYYGTSDIDRLLNEEYFTTLDEEVQQIIVTSQLEITALEALKVNRKGTEIIQRKVFLLSATELGVPFTSIISKEGGVLSYYRTHADWMAYREDGTAGSWFLRTPDISEDNRLIAIAYDGSAGGGPVYAMGQPVECGIRPAFRIPASTPIIRSETEKEEFIYLLQPVHH